jgi:hypothetical protein
MRQSVVGDSRNSKAVGNGKRQIALRFVLGKGSFNQQAGYQQTDKF